MLDDYLTADFLRAMWYDLHAAPWSRELMRPGTHKYPYVAIHIRRGDRVPIADDVYLDLVTRIKTRLPTAAVHIFSDEGSVNQLNFTRAGARLHLGGTDLLEIWAQMLSADVLVVAPSSFSTVPAYIKGGLAADPALQCTIVADPRTAGRRHHSQLAAWSLSWNKTAVDKCLDRVRK